MSGPIYGNQFPTPDAKVRRKNNIEPKSLHNHVNTTRLAGTPPLRHEYNTLNKPCPGCGEDKLLRYRENCPNKNKICYNCGRLGHIREVCRTMKYQITGRNDCQRTEPWPADIKWDIEFPLPTSEFRGMSQYPYLPIRSFGKPGTLAEQHKKWINDEPCGATEVEAEKKRWINHFRQRKKSRAQSQDLDGEGRKRSVWWHAFLIETGNIELDDTNYD